LLLCSDGLSGMVRNDELRVLMSTIEDPFELCKALTDRANLAGGHDNITVIVSTFDGNDIPSKSAEKLRYRKYAFPDTAPTHTVPLQAGPRSKFGTLPAPSETPTDPPSPPAPEDAIELPGTHVPGWLAAILVIGVVGVILLAALVLLK
jgi:hypothetical protein